MADLRPDARARFSKTLTRLRQRGAVEVAEEWQGAMRSWLASRGELIVLMRAPSENVPERQGLRFREAAAGDAEAYARWIGTDSASTFRDRLSPSTHCFLVFDDDRIVHASWLATQAAWIGEIQAYFRPPAGEGYVYESFTLPEARGRGIYPHALDRIATWSAERELKRLWIAVEAGNVPSRRAIDKAGFREAFRIRYLTRFGRRSVDPPVGAHAHLCSRCIGPTPEPGTH